MIQHTGKRKRVNSMTSSVVSSNKTIAKNTFFLYGRMLFNLAVSLYTSRVILQVLGVEDLGTYQIVGGIVGLFSFIQSALSGATSRFLAFELGRADISRLHKTFSATVFVHAVAALLILILCETVGLWLVYNKLVIPERRMDAALIVYQCAVAMSMISVCQVPYNASIIAHERMDVFAYVGILDTVMKLVACYLVYIIYFDKLILYGIILLLFSFGILFIYWVYCRRNFKECHFSFHNDKSIVKPILLFSGWDLLGNISYIMKLQGINIIQNMYFGVVINAALGFATSVYAAVSGFANNFMMSIRPAVTKAYASGNFERAQQLMIDGGKYSFCLMLLMSSPFFTEGDYLINLWLKTPPEYTALFCKLQLLTCLIAVVAQPVTFCILATGSNKRLSFFDSLSMLAIFLISYFLLYNGHSPSSPFIVGTIIEFIKSGGYLFILKRLMPDFSILNYCRKSILPCLLLLVITVFLTCIPFLLIREDGWEKFILVVGCSTATIIVSMWLFIIPASTKIKLQQKLIFRKK